MLTLLMRSRARYVLITSAVILVIFETLLLGPWFFRSTPQQSDSSQPEILVSYSWEYTDRIAQELQPPAGRVFLVIRMTIENSGYANFTADPFRDMFVVVDVQSYNVSVAYFFLQDRFKPTNIVNGTNASGEVVFEVPAGSTSFQPRWRTLTDVSIDIRFFALAQLRY